MFETRSLPMYVNNETGGTRHEVFFTCTPTTVAKQANCFSAVCPCACVRAHTLAKVKIQRQ